MVQTHPQPRHKKDNYMKITGVVTKQLINKGSKSEHVAICLSTSDGSYVLRRKDSNPFSVDADAAKLVGESVQFVGIPHSGHFIFESFRQQETNQEIE